MKSPSAVGVLEPVGTGPVVSVAEGPDAQRPGWEEKGEQAH